MKAANNSAESPLMKQYSEIKAKYPGVILLFRVGDFYETFGEDAKIASKVLGIVLTRKMCGGGNYTELAGIPYHAVDNYLPRLVRAGYKVAICDQLEDPKLTKKLVKRGVSELVTPGIAYNDDLLCEKENNFLCAAVFEGDRGGVAFLDISTGTFKVAEGSLQYIEILLNDFQPKEILLRKSYKEGFRNRFGEIAYLSTADDWLFVHDSAVKKLCGHFHTPSLKGFGISDMNLALTAAGAVLFYLELTEHTEVSHIRTISRIDSDSFVWMDRFTVRNLELFHSLSGDEGVSLLQVIDRCSSPMGARRLREWLAMPLKDVEKIASRHDAVQAFAEDETVRESVRTHLSDIGDLERIISKAAAGRIAPREMLQLARGLNAISHIVEECADIPAIASLVERLDGCSELSERILSTIRSDSAQNLGKGSVIAAGVSADLDSYRNILENSKEILLGIQEREKERTGIASLKISYNNIFGYYLEVRNTYSDKVPEDWIRKQTLVNAERYITPELKEYEEKIVSAESVILQIETEIYRELVTAVQSSISAIQADSDSVASIDCLAGFAQLAVENDYCRPVVDDDLRIRITAGRHPVIEKMMPPGEEYVANDLFLDNRSQQIIILTGPNMAGKSAFLRQTALSALLAQIGSFVPAKAAEIGFIDKLFTRVGASDNISRGESTFMVEMTETSTILNNLSERSLVLLDEIGRGTSTYDGMSIAWSIVEYLHEGESEAGSRRRVCSPRPKTLFATHYHELNELEKIYPRVRNYHISTREIDGTIIFLRKLTEGGVAHSFGIHVARLAGMPRRVLNSAERKLRELEEGRATASKETLYSSGDFSGRMAAEDGSARYLPDEPDALDRAAVRVAGEGGVSVSDGSVARAAGEGCASVSERTAARTTGEGGASVSDGSAARVAGKGGVSVPDGSAARAAGEGCASVSDGSAARVAGEGCASVSDGSAARAAGEGGTSVSERGAGRRGAEAVQLTLYQLDDPLLADIRRELEEMDINKLSPLDAFDKLRELKRKIGL